MHPPTWDAEEADSYLKTAVESWTSTLLTSGNNDFGLKWIVRKPDVPGRAYFTWSSGTRRENTFLTFTWMEVKIP
jgi:hypothetical protein